MKKGYISGISFPVPHVYTHQGNYSKHYCKIINSAHIHFHFFLLLLVSKGSETDSDEEVEEKKKNSPMALGDKEIDSDDEFDHFYD